MADEEEEDDGVTCFRAKKLRSWQLARGVTDDRGGTLTRLLPFDLDPDRVWEIMTSLDLVDKVGGPRWWLGRTHPTIGRPSHVGKGAG